MNDHRKTRKKLDIWLLGTLKNPDIVGDLTEGENLDYIYYNRQLPTVRQVLSHLFHLKSEEMKGMPLRQVSDRVVNQVLKIWDEAKIPTIWKLNVVLKLEKLFNDWRTLQKKKSSVKSKDQQNRDVFVKNLDILFDISPQDYKEKILADRTRTPEAKQEDLIFIADQRGPRKMTMDKVDEEYAATMEKREKRMVDKLKREDKDRELKRRFEKNNNETEYSEEDQVYEPEVDQKEDEDFTEIIKKPKNDKITLNVPKNILANREVAIMADRLGQSDRALTGVMATFIKASGGDLEDFSLSKTTATRERNRVRKEEHDRFFENYVPPKHAVVGEYILTKLNQRSLFYSFRLGWQAGEGCPWYS